MTLLSDEYPCSSYANTDGHCHCYCHRLILLVLLFNCNSNDHNNNDPDRQVLKLLKIARRILTLCSHEYAGRFDADPNGNSYGNRHGVLLFDGYHDDDVDT